MSAPPCPTLAAMYATGRTAVGTPLDSHLPEDAAAELARQVAAVGPATALEVGCANGVSTLAVLSALPPGGRLVSVDPFQSSQWRGAGVAAVRAAGFAGRHELVEDFDYLALPRLLAAGLRLDFAFIDGWHTFDYTLLDFWYCDRMLRVGGVVGFDDARLPAVAKAIAFALSHRKYEEVPTRLRGPDPGRLRRWLGLRKGPNNRYLRKRAAWEPDWDFFADF